VRHAVGTPYRQRVLANVIAASTPLQAVEAAYNVALAYRPDLLDVAVSDLTPDLLGPHSQGGRLPQDLVRELVAYPGWQAAAYPGASVSSALQHTLDSSWP